MMHFLESSSSFVPPSILFELCFLPLILSFNLAIFFSPQYPAISKLNQKQSQNKRLISASMDNTRSIKGESQNVVLESVEIDDMANEPLIDVNPSPQNSLPPLPKTGSRNLFKRTVSNLKSSSKGNGIEGVGPRFGRAQSGALRGIKSVRFLDKKKLENKGDAWNDVEKRFEQMAVDGKLSRDKFGICVGTIYLVY